jgi:hypothetical protein
VTVGLLTCDREDQTRITLDTFLAHNDPARFRLIHADGGSATSANADMAAAAGFETIYAPSERVSQFAAVKQLVAAAAGADWLLYLEADQEFVRPVPLEVLDFPVECVRLQGAMKGRSGPRASSGTCLMGTRTPIVWCSYAEGYDRGWAHFPGQPNLCRPTVLREIMAGAVRMKDMCVSRALDTVRVTENVCYHLCQPTTEGFRD